MPTDAITRADIERAVEDLFVNGFNMKGNRLVLVNDQLGQHQIGWNLGGWCKQSVVDQLCKSLGVKDAD